MRAVARTPGPEGGPRRTGTLLPHTTAGRPVPWKDLLLVALGGALGALLRFGAHTMLPRIAFPWTTLAVNLLGSFLLGLLFLPQGMEHGPRLFLAVGVLGAFTTLSTFSVETVELWREGRAALAVLNVTANGIGGPVMALLGLGLRPG